MILTYLVWRANYEALLKREEESYITNIAVKIINLLVINTSEVRFEINLDNNSIIEILFHLGHQSFFRSYLPYMPKNFL